MPLVGAVDQIMAEAREEKALEVSWKAPRHPNGEIVMYRMTTVQNEDVISVVDFHRNWVSDCEPSVIIATERLFLV